MAQTTINLPAGKILVVTAPAGSGGGTVNRFGIAGEATNYPSTTVEPGASITIGPFTSAHDYAITSASVPLHYAVSQPDESPVLSTNDVAIIQNDGAPDNGAQAALTTTLSGSDNDLVFTAVAVGESGNAISIQYVDPAANNVPLSAQVVGKAITITLETDGEGAIATIADDISALTELDGIVTVANSGADDGSGTVTAMAKTHLADGADATGQGKAGTGSLVIDYTNGAAYINAGTIDVPSFKRLLTEDDL